MKIYISSTYTDLREHRQAVARVLRQMGHRPVGMEDYVAEGMRPLSRCLEDVRNCDVYVGLFAWRYGYVPQDVLPPGLTPPENTIPLVTSITEYELRQAIDAKKHPLLFLLDPEAPWPSSFFDAVTGDGDQGARISALRADLAQDYLVNFFNTPEDLASRVSAAVYRREMDHRMDLESLHPDLTFGEPFRQPGPLDDSTLGEIINRISPADDVDALEVNVGAGLNWWSTRLYFLASLAADLTEVRVMVFVDDDRHFIGMAPPDIVRERLVRAYPILRKYERALGKQRAPDIQQEVERRASKWEQVMGMAGGEDTVKAWVTRQELRRWLASYLISEAVQWSADESSALQMQRIIEWPGPYVPVQNEGVFLRVVNRGALAEQIARLFLKEQASRQRAF